MKRLKTLLAAPVVAAVAAHAASAATLEPLDAPYSVRFGGAASSDGGAAGRVGLMVGASRELGPGRVDIDFTRHASHGNRTQVAGLSYVYRIPFENRFYGGLGLGVHHVSVKSGASGASFDNDRVVLGGKILIGYRISSRFFAEAVMTKLGSVSGVDPSTFSFVLGMHF